jgi:hypothetical protein
MNTLNDVENLSNPGPAVQDNFELLDWLLTYNRKGVGSPEGVVTAPVSACYHRLDGGPTTSFYVKESGSGNTGWIAK